jgi:ABC-type multidrug transport system fused ATPase/permease subunit
MIKTWLRYLKKGLSRRLPEVDLAVKGKQSGFWDGLQNIYPYLKKHWRKGIIGFLIIIFAALLAFPPPLITRYLIDEIILNRQIDLLLGALGMLLAVLVAEKLLRVLESFYFAQLEQRITLEIHQDLISRVLRLPKAFFDDHQTGYLMSRLSEDVEGLRLLFSSSVVYILSNILRFIGGIGFLVYLEWRLALIVLMLLPGLAFIIRYFSGKIHALSHNKMEQKGKTLGRFQESLSEATLIKSFASEDRAQKRLMNALKHTFQISLEQTSVNALAGVVINSMPGISRLIVFAIGAFWVVNGQWTLGSLLAYLAYIAYVFGPARFLASANLQLQEAWAALQRVNDLFNLVPEENPEAGKGVDRLSGEIEFRNVSFAYNGSPPVLKDLSLRIRSGERIAIVGPSGVGKTTLLSLIMRFYRPTKGEIFFDGLPASDYNLRSLRRRIGYVSQRPQLFAGSILENLRYGNPDADREKVKQIAKISGIHDFINSLSDGYNTQIGENGLKLSEGQKQRMSVARALIKDPDILILDEPTAALDNKTEKSFLDALPAALNGKTLFIATHRPAIIKNADRVFVLNENRLVDVDTHQSFRETNTYYREMMDNHNSKNEGFRCQVSAKGYKNNVTSHRPVRHLIPPKLMRSGKSGAKRQEY